MFEALIDEMTELSAPELDVVIERAELAKRDAEARLAAAAAIISARGGFRDHGHRSMRGYLKATLNCSGTAASRIRKRADVVNAHPAIGSALLAGRIGVEQVDLFAKAHAHPVAGKRLAEFLSMLLDHAEQLEHDDFATVMKEYEQRADPDGSFDDQAFREQERHATVTDSGGSIEVHASGGSPLAAAEMKAIFDDAVEAEFRRDCGARREVHGDDALAHPLPRTGAQRKFDALHNIFLGYVAVPADAKTPEPLVNILIDHVTAGRVLHAHGLVDSPDVLGLGGDSSGDVAADLQNRYCSVNGTPIHPDTALEGMITGRIRRAVVDADRVTIDLGRTQRLFTGKAREAAQLLVVTCTHRGCDIPVRFCDVDHRDEWVADGGPTDQHNAMPLCGVHDRWKHRHRLRTRRAANGRLYLIGPDGSTVRPIGAREPAWAEPSAPDMSPPAASVETSGPFARFGRPLTPTELAGRDIPDDIGRIIRIVAYDDLRAG